MLVADIKGKLSLSETTSEDFLTSAVFSAFKYLGPRYLNEFLNNAINSEGKHLELSLEKPDYSFWPWFGSDDSKVGGAEPDVVLSAENLTIIVEAKNYSGKSGSGIVDLTNEQSTGTSDYRVDDQLAREYNIGLKHKSKDFLLIYLTRDSVIPVKDIDESIESIAKHWPDERRNARKRIYWVNWQVAYLIFEKLLNNSNATVFEQELCNDMVQFLERRDLDTFAGFDFSDFHISPSIFISESQKVLKEASIFFSQEESKYWDTILNQQLKYNNNQTLFYSETHDAYWRFLKGHPELKQPKSIYYD